MKLDCYERPVSIAEWVEGDKEGRDLYREQLDRVGYCYARVHRLYYVLIGVALVTLLVLIAMLIVELVGIG